MISENGLHLVPDYRAESTVATVTGTLTSANYVTACSRWPRTRR